MTLVELGDDWERTEVLHKKFEEFQEELTARKGKVDKVNQYANECAQVRWKQKRHSKKKDCGLQELMLTHGGLREECDIVRK